MKITRSVPPHPHFFYTAVVVHRVGISGLFSSVQFLTTLHFVWQDVSKDVIEHGIREHVMKILVLGSAAEGATPTDVIIVIDGTEVMAGCKTVTNACILLMGFVYSLNLSYPPKLRYTFEVFQKLFLELDDLKFSPKVDSLRRKLLLQ